MLRRVNPLVVATVAALAAMLLPAAMPETASAALSLQAIKQRTRATAWERCKAKEIVSRGYWQCHDKTPSGKPNVHVWGCVYRSLTFRKASCEADFNLISATGRRIDHCYGRAVWRGNLNDVRLTSFRISCVDALQARARPLAHAAHYLHLADARLSLLGANGDNDIYPTTGGQGFVWGSYTRDAASHHIWQWISWGPGQACRARFHVYFPNSSNTVYDARDYYSCVV